MIEANLGEIQRMLASMVRIGTVLEVNHAKCSVKVKADDLTTAWIKWATGRAGEVRKWSPLSVGEQVVLLSPHGDTAKAVIIAVLYQNKFPAPSNSPDKELTQYPDGTTVEYDSASHSLNVQCASGSTVNVTTETVNVTSDNVNITASSKVTIQAEEMDINGKVKIQGDTEIQGAFETTGTFKNNGKNVGSTLKVTNVQSGLGVSGEPV